jgi:hypothetical protein
MSPGYSGSSAVEAIKAQEAKVHTSPQPVAAVSGDPHLRSCAAVIGYAIHANDGDIGHVKGMLVDESDWAIRYLVVDTSNWWVGHQVLIAPDWLTEISWEKSAVSVNLTRKSIQESPGFNSTATLNRQHETDLYLHYKRPTYWELARQEDRRRERQLEEASSQK